MSRGKNGNPGVRGGVLRVRVYKGGRGARGVGGVQVMVMLVVRKYYFYDNFFESTSRFRKKKVPDFRFETIV